MDDTLPYWYLAYTKPRQEHTATINLQQQGFIVYLPLYKTRKRKTEGGYDITYPPMFPRYLFFKPSRAEQSLATVRSTLGVSHLLRVGSDAGCVSNDIVDNIRQAEACRNQIDLNLSPKLRAGSKARILSGSLQGLEGLVESSTSNRLILLLDILGRRTRVALPSGDVEQI